jgi:hypothetical protein
MQLNAVHSRSLHQPALQPIAGSSKPAVAARALVRHNNHPPTRDTLAPVQRGPACAPHRATETHRSRLDFRPSDYDH